MGYTEVLYVMELIGITLIWIGYNYNVRPTALSTEGPRAEPVAA